MGEIRREERRSALQDVADRAMSRRDVIAGVVAAAFGLATPRTALANDDPGLRRDAARKGLTFGCAVQSASIRSDPAFRALVIANADMIVPEFEMKWAPTEAQRGRFTYDRCEEIVGFARGNGLGVRGHTAVWYRSLPAWASEALSGPEAMSVFHDHIHGLLSRFRGRVQQWDVVNEALEPNDKNPKGLRNSPFLQRLGPDYILEAFRIARRAAPEAKLFYNDYSLEYDTDYEYRKRDATLGLVDRLRGERLIDGLGLQSHLKVGNRFNATRYRAFLKDVAALGVDILATEFNVIDTRLPSDLALRDPQVAAHARMFLDVLLDEQAVSGVITWGLATRYSDLNTPAGARSDGTSTRGLPYDETLRPTALHDAISGAFDKAARRERG